MLYEYEYAFFSPVSWFIISSCLVYSLILVFPLHVIILILLMAKKIGWYSWSQYSLTFRYIGETSSNGFQVFVAYLLQK